MDSSSLVGTAISSPSFNNTLQSLLSPENQKDQIRFSEAQQWYSQAIQGDSIALCFLQHMGGLRGCATCGGTQACGFATDTAKKYCEQLYQQAVKVLGGQLSPSAPTPPAPSPTPSTVGQIGQTAGTVSTITGGIATATGQTPAPSTAQKLQFASDAAKVVLVVAVVGFLAYLAIRATRSA